MSNGEESDNESNEKNHAVFLSESTNFSTNVRRYSKRKNSFTHLETQINGLDNECENQLSVIEEEDGGECLGIGLNSDSQPEDSVGASEKENEQKGSKTIIFDDITEPVEEPFSTGIRRRFVDTSISSSAASTDSKKRKYFCEVENCHSSFFHQATYKRHLKIHETTSSTTCKICFKKFDNTTKLMEHQLQVHNGQSHKFFPCSHCDKSFSTEEYRKRHLQRVKKDGTLLICIHCNKIFHNRSDFDYHVKHTHPENREFSCKECGKEFKRETHAIAHIKTHFSTDTHACNICNRVFNDSFVLNRHIAVHNDNKHSCNVCGAGFTHKISLMKHLNQQHPKFQDNTQKQVKSEQVYEYKLP